jgi:hypothetical protein
VNVTETFIELIQKIFSKYLKLDRIEDGKCHKYASGGYTGPHKDRRVSEDHIFNLVMFRNSKDVYDSGLYLNNRQIYGDRICLFDPEIEHEVKTVRQERISYTFKVFGKMNWYKYFLHNYKSIPPCQNFMGMVIEAWKNPKRFYTFKGDDTSHLVLVANLKHIMEYSKSYKAVIASICNILELESLDPDKDDYYVERIDIFYPKNIYHVVFQDDTEQDFIGISEIRGNIKTITLKKLTDTEQITHYLTEIKNDIDEKYTNYLNNLDEEKVIAEIKEYQIPTDTLMCVVLSNLYESGVPYEALHPIDKKIYDHFASMTQQIQIKTVNLNECKNVINVFEPSPYRNVKDYSYDVVGRYETDIHISGTCLMIYCR